MNKKSIYLYLILVAVAGILVVGFFLIPKNEDTGSIDYGPPTELEQAAGDEKKKEIAENESKQSGEPDTSNSYATKPKQSVDVIITDASQYGDIIEVRAFVQGHIEQGQCTVTLQRDSTSKQFTSPAYPDATTTICTNPKIEVADLPSGGTWQVTVTYENNTSEGTSEVRSIEVKK